MRKRLHLRFEQFLNSEVICSLNYLCYITSKICHYNGSTICRQNTINIFNLFFSMGHPRPLFVYFRSFSNKQYKFYNKSMGKNIMSIQYPAPEFEPTTLKHESPPITTGPGLPPKHIQSLSLLMG